MTRDVLVKISGMQTDLLEQGGDPEDAPVEIITPASYFCKNGKHYVIYEEVTEGMQGITKNKIKIQGQESMEIMKSGNVNAHMVFQKDKKSVTYYNTPYGQMVVGIYTTGLKVDVTEDHIKVKLNYGLDINNEPFADCEIRMQVQSKDVRQFP